MDHPRPWLRYVDAGDLESAGAEFDGLPVQSASGDKLGKVEGFVVDSISGRPFYVVVHAGGWFKAKHYLLPIGHARLDSARNALVADLTRDRIDRFPGFDKYEFEKLSDADLDRLDSSMASACCPGDKVSSTTQSRADRWSHHKYPDWWQAEYVNPDRAGARGVTAGAEYITKPPEAFGERAMAHDSSRKKE